MSFPPGAFPNEPSPPPTQGVGEQPDPASSWPSAAPSESLTYDPAKVLVDAGPTIEERVATLEVYVAALQAGERLNADGVAVDQMHAPVVDPPEADSEIEQLRRKVADLEARSAPGS